MVKYDPDLIKNCLKKDRVAQNKMYVMCFNFMMSICWRYTDSKEEAVEFVNAGFLKIMINLKKYKKNVPFELWVRRVIVNEVIDIIRKRKNYRASIEIRDEEKLPEIVQDEDLSDLQLEKLQWIKVKTKDLPKVTSRVFNLYAFDGYKHAEIAKMLDISKGTSQWHVSTAKKKLKQWSDEF